jgi:hypothetical protein
MAKPQAIRWRDPENWRRVIRDARATVGASINDARRTAPGWDIGAAWWVKYGATVSKINRLGREIAAGMDALKEKRGASWYRSAATILKASPAIVKTDRWVNTEGARREAVAKAQDTYLRLLETAATVRQGLQDGTTRTTLDKIKTSERRSPPSSVVPTFEFNFPNPLKKAAFLIGGLYVLTIFMGRK